MNTGAATIANAMRIMMTNTAQAILRERLPGLRLIVLMKFFRSSFLGRVEFEERNDNRKLTQRHGRLRFGVSWFTWKRARQNPKR